jgi:hypothetical protein
MSPSYVPKAGDTVYNVEGEMAFYVSTAKGGGYIVQPLIEDGDGVSEPEGHYADGVAIWPRVYKEAPQPMLDQAIAEQHARLALLRGEVRAMEQQKREAERDQTAMKERLAMHQALVRLDDLLSGRVTHYVVDRSDNSNKNWVVVPAEEFFKLRTHYSTVAMTLHCSLHSGSRSVVQWKFSANPDRDAGRDAFAFMSEAEAREKVAELVHASLREAASHSNNSYWLRQRIQWADTQGVAVPDEVRLKLSQLERVEAEAERERARKALESAEAALANLAPSQQVAA